MGKDNRRIAGSIRVSGKGVFREGQEDELAAALSAEELKTLTENGVIEGFAKTKPEKSEK